MSAPKQPGEGRDIAETMELDAPVKCWDKTLDRLEFTKPTAKHLAIIDAHDGYEQIARLIMSLADVPLQTVERLSLEDYKRAEAIVHRFFEAASRPSPSGPSPTGDEAP